MNNFLLDLDKDIFVYSENRYKVKRYSYKKFNYIDPKGEPITERVFSFILMHGKDWFNDTHLNFKESELNDVIGKYKELLIKKREERRNALTEEKELRKEFPKKTQWKFNNVTITLIEEIAYYNKFLLKGQKSYTVYANELPYRYLINKVVDMSLEFSTEKILSYISSYYTTPYNITKLSRRNDKYRSEVVKESFDYDFVPYHFFLGMVVEIDNVRYTIKDCFGGTFKTDKGELKVKVTELNELTKKIVGEAEGMEAFISIKNKLKFME